MTVETIVGQLHGAGLNLSLVRSGGLAVAPSSHLTEDLRDLIRGNKALLIGWLTAANDEDSQAIPTTRDDPADWRALGTAYMAHHFNCKTCIAAGRGIRYGLRCGIGVSLWRAYREIEDLRLCSQFLPP